NVVQTQVRRDAIEQARGVTPIQPPPLFQHADEHLLTAVNRVVIVAEEPAAPPEHHRRIPADKRFDVCVSHAAYLNTGGERNCHRKKAHHRGHGETTQPVELIETNGFGFRPPPNPPCALWAGSFSSMLSMVCFCSC